MDWSSYSRIKHWFCLERWIPGQLNAYKVFLFSIKLLNIDFVLKHIHNNKISTICSQVNFQHWQEGEPNNFNNAESCAEFVIHNWDEEGSWNDLNCESFNDWLCQISAGTTHSFYII